MEVGDINPCMNYLVPGAGVEPARCKAPRDFKSLVSTSSTTRAIHVNIAFFGTVQRVKELYGRLMDWPCIVNNLLHGIRFWSLIRFYLKNNVLSKSKRSYAQKNVDNSYLWA